MLNKLKQRWGVNGVQLVLIICTFALGGSLCGYAGKKLISLTHMEKGVPWILVYILLVIILWPLCVLLISIPFGQFAFFRKYVNKVFFHTNKVKSPPARIAIFASGTGTNAGKIIEYFKQESNAKDARVSLIISNKPGAGVLGIAAASQIPTLIIEKELFFNGGAYLEELKRHQVDWIVLAGFLWKIPDALIKTYPQKIINIHPALLPKYGGKGMYGDKVHQTVIANKEKESGITIHFVDEQYDHGEIIFQAKCIVDPTDSPESLAWKIHVLEHANYPEVIHKAIVVG